MVIKIWGEELFDTNRAKRKDDFSSIGSIFQGECIIQTKMNTEIWWGSVPASPAATEWYGHRPMGVAPRKRALIISRVVSLHICFGLIPKSYFCSLPWITPSKWVMCKQSYIVELVYILYIPVKLISFKVKYNKVCTSMWLNINSQI